MFQNNIFYVATTQASYVNPGSLLFDSDVFYGQHPAGEPTDAHKITADPLLTAPGAATSRTDTAGYKLGTGSPAIGSGQALLAADGRDYFGDTVQAGCRPDRGAHQLSRTCVPQSAPSLADGTYKITAGSMVVDDPASSTTAGTQLIVYTQHPAANQQWQVQRNTDGTYTLRSSTSGLCADVNQNSVATGAAIIRWTCSGADNQRWTLTPSGSGYTPTARNSGLLLTAASLTDNVGLTQQPASAAGNHVWQFTAAS